MKRRADNLETYRQKRNFKVTSEPAPGKKPSRKSAEKKSAGPTFMVHKHDATRLHYDLRLEMDEALASWAIPKGPSYDVGQKRLAVQTEDHPLEYGGFEGRIPEGEYGAGDSIIWDRGTYDTVPPGQASEQRKRGRMHIALHGEKLEGEWHLVRTRLQGSKQQWLIFKAHDGKERAGYDVEAERPESVKTGKRVTRGPVRKKALAAAAFTRPEKLLEQVWPPMTATLSEEGSASEKTHLFEVKYDGFRALAALTGGKLALESRNHKDFTKRFPPIAAALAKLKVAEAVIDGEIIALDGKGVSQFQGLGDAGAKLQLACFDLLWLDGQDLRGRPLEERRELLESVLANVPRSEPIVLSERVEGSAKEAMAQARARKLEGVIAKERHSLYEGRRSPAWLKLKVTGEQEVVIVGFTPISNGRKEIGALLLGVREGDSYRFAGKVGTGFDAKMRASLFRQLTALKADAPTVTPAPRPAVRGAIWVKPELVAEVKFVEWTRDGKLRHPAFLGLREDKSAEEVVQEKPEKVKASARPSTRTQAAPEVVITHPERKVFPKSGITKADVAAYYRAVAPLLVNALADRPLSFQAWPRGIDQPGFFRHSAASAPVFVTRKSVAHADHPTEHVIVDSEATVAWLANQSALTLHMTNSHLPTLEKPDWVAFDFDPVGDTWEQLVPLARAMRGLLESLKLKSFPKTSGKRGLHVLVPLKKGPSHDDVVQFAVKLTEALAARFPKQSTTLRALTARKGRLYLDAHQNGGLKTLVSPYSLRAVEGAPVSTPIEWDEVSEKLEPALFNLRTLEKRLAKVGDLFAPVLTLQQILPDVR